MANFVLDASAVIRIIEGAEQSVSFQEAVLTADLVLAPELMLTEVANALWRLQRAGLLPADGLQQRLIPPLPAKLTPLHPDHFFHQGA